MTKEDPTNEQPTVVRLDPKQVDQIRDWMGALHERLKEIRDVLRSLQPPAA